MRSRRYRLIFARLSALCRSSVAAARTVPDEITSMNSSGEAAWLEVVKRIGCRHGSSRRADRHRTTTRRGEARPRPGPSALALTRWRSGFIAPRRFLFTISNSLVFFTPGVFLLRVLSLFFLLSFLIPDRGDGGVPGGGILSPVAPVTARHHVCEAWAVPRNRDDASRRSPVTVLGPVPALRLRSCLRCLSRATLAPGACVRSAKGPEPPGNGFTTRSGTPHPAPPSGSSPETPLDERDFGFIAQARLVVNIVIITYS